MCFVNLLISLNWQLLSVSFYPGANETLHSYFEKPAVFCASLFLD